MSRRITKAKRAFLLAVVRGEVCTQCRCATASPLGFLCGPCMVKRMDDALPRRPFPGRLAWP